MSSLKRRIAAGVLALPLLVITGCGNGDDPGAAGGKSVSIGLIVPTQGAQAALGSEVAAGFELALKDASTDGYTFTPAIADEGTTPDKAVEAARSLVAKGAKNVAGLVSSADCAAVAPVIDQLGGTLVSSTCSLDSLTSPKPVTKSFFSVAAGDQRYDAALAAIVAESFPSLTQLGVFAWDYPTGRAIPGIVQEKLEKNGLTVKLDPEVYVPIQASSYRAEISKMAGNMKGGDPDTKGILLVTGGSATTSFLQQSRAFDLLDSVSFVGAAAEPYLGLRTLKGNFPSFWASYDYFHGAVDSEENKKFIAAFEAKQGVKPSGFAWQGYVAGSALAAAVKKAGSDQPAGVQKALLEVDVPTPTGDVKFNTNDHRTNSPSVVVNVVGDPAQSDGVKTVSSYRVAPDGRKVE